MFKHLVDILHERNVYHFFVFTTPSNEKVFLSLNMTTVVKTMNTVLLESGENIEQVLNELKLDYNLSNKKKSCVIINANPMTLGHLYLIETASKESDEVIISLSHVDHDKKRLHYKLEMYERSKNILSATTEVLALYINLDERKVSEFENEKVKLMDDFINLNKSSFNNNNLIFNGKLKK